MKPFVAVIAACLAGLLLAAPAKADSDLDWFFNMVRNIDPQAGSDSDIALSVQLSCYMLEKQGYKAQGRKMVDAGYTEEQAVRLLALYKQVGCPNVVDPPFAS